MRVAMQVNFRWIRSLLQEVLCLTKIMKVCSHVGVDLPQKGSAGALSMPSLTRRRVIAATIALLGVSLLSLLPRIFDLKMV